MTPLDEHGSYISADTTLVAGAVASAARTASGNGSAFQTVRTNSIEGYLTVTAASGTTPTLDVRLETSLDAGTSWQTVAAFAQATATTTKNKVFGPLGDSCRWAWTIAGTTPSFTFSVAAEANN